MCLLLFLKNCVSQVIWAVTREHTSESRTTSSFYIIHYCENNVKKIVNFGQSHSIVGFLMIFAQVSRAGTRSYRKKSGIGVFLLGCFHPPTEELNASGILARSNYNRSTICLTKINPMTQTIAVRVRFSLLMARVQEKSWGEGSGYGRNWGIKRGTRSLYAR